jgi:hypothetical protein
MNKTRPDLRRPNFIQGVCGYLRTLRCWRAIDLPAETCSSVVGGCVRVCAWSDVPAGGLRAGSLTVAWRRDRAESRCSGGRRAAWTGCRESSVEPWRAQAVDCLPHWSQRGPGGASSNGDTRETVEPLPSHNGARLSVICAAESGYLARKAEDEKTGLPEAPVPPEVDLAQRVWFPTLEVELSDEAAEYLERLRRLQIEARQGEVPDLLARQLTSAFLV